jgi:hypothetical protein
MLQVRHMLFELITLEDIIVSVEKLDDVAIQSSDESVIAEQIKSVTSDNNPTTDRSVVIWKTFFNWFNYVQDGSLILDKTRFCMIVISNHKLEIGDVLNKFNKVSTKEEAQKALRDVKLQLWGEDNKLRNMIPTSYGQYLDVLFLPSNEELVTQIIAKTTVVIYENDYDEKLIEKFKRQPIPQEFADNLLIYMLGWVTEKANEKLKHGLPPIISHNDYNGALVAQCKAYNERHSIPTLSNQITSEEARMEVESQDIYIQQLDLIETNFDDKLEAANDYLRTKAEVTLRADKGLFVPQSLDEYKDKIRRLWKNKREQVLLLQVGSDVNKGKLLYVQTSETVSNYKLEGCDPPSFFGSGTLQALANEPPEEPIIGWHPNYKKLLKGEKENG